MFILKKGHQPGVYVPLRALFLVQTIFGCCIKAVNNSGILCPNCILGHQQKK